MVDVFPDNHSCVHITCVASPLTILQNLIKACQQKGAECPITEKNMSSFISSGNRTLFASNHLLLRAWPHDSHDEDGVNIDMIRSSVLEILPSPGSEKSGTAAHCLHLIFLLACWVWSGSQETETWTLIFWGINQCKVQFERRKTRHYQSERGQKLDPTLTSTPSLLMAETPPNQCQKILPRSTFLRLMVSSTLQSSEFQLERWKVWRSLCLK